MSSPKRPKPTKKPSPHATAQIQRKAKPSTGFRYDGQLTEVPHIDDVRIGDDERVTKQHLDRYRNGPDNCVGAHPSVTRAMVREIDLLRAHLDSSATTPFESRDFVERTLNRLRRTADRQGVEMLLSTLTLDELCSLIAAGATRADADALAKLVDRAAAATGEQDKADPTYDIEAALVRFGCSPARSAKVFDLFDKALKRIEGASKEPGRG